MDSKSIENFLKMIIKIDDSEIANRESQLKKIASDVEANSEVLKASHSKRLVERIKIDTEMEQEMIMKESDVLMSDMDRIFNEKKSKMIHRAFEKLSIGRWES